MDRANVHNWGTLISEEQLEEIGNMVKTLELSQSTIGENNDIPDALVRLNMTGWFNKKEHKRMFELGEAISSLANRDLYGMDISGGIPEVQYSTYTEGHHYDWHMDIDWWGQRMQDRKISIIIVLSNPDEYEGGELQFDDAIGGAVLEEKPAKGTVITFPSYLRHKVTPVTKGIRASIVIWVEGPRFR
jgi:PKHD-type hydroxylase